MKAIRFFCAVLFFTGVLLSPDSRADDALEDNDTSSQLTETWWWQPTQQVSDAIGGWAVQSDDDWFSVLGGSSYYFLYVTALHSSASGVVDVEVYRYSDTGFVAGTDTNSNSDVETVAGQIQNGQAKVRVFGDNSGVNYDMSWAWGAPPAQLALDSSSLAEVAGILDGRPTSGDTLDLSTTISNLSIGGIATNPVGTLVSTTALLSVSQPVLYYTNLHPFLTTPSTNNARFSISSSCPGGYIASLDLVLDCDNGTPTTNPVSFRVYGQDDGYEENDTPGQAAALTPGTPVTAAQADTDWFSIVIPDARWVYATCSFTHAYGDLALKLYDDQTNLLDSSSGGSDKETVSALVYSGTYYLEVTGEDFGTDYDLAYATRTPAPPSIQLDSFAIKSEAGPNADDDGEADPGETVTLSFSISNTGELRSTNLILSLAGGDADVWPDLPPSITAGTVEASSAGSFTGLTATVDWQAVHNSLHSLQLIATDEQQAWTNSFNLLVQGVQDDAYEYNSLPGYAYNLPEDTWLDTIAGLAKQGDDDWYLMVPSDPTNRYYYAEIIRWGNTNDFFQLQVRSGASGLLGWSTNQLYTNLFAEGGDTYTNFGKIKVIGVDTGESYNLRWTSMVHYADFDGYTYSVSGTNGLTDPGDTLDIYITMTNMGPHQYPPALMEISSTSTNVSITTWSNMTAWFDPGETHSNTTPFQVTVLSTATNNETVTIQAVSDQRGMVAPSFQFQFSISADEDAYEPNNSELSAYALPQATPLSSINGPGIQADVDYYALSGASMEWQYLVLTCSFTHADNNIDIEIFNSSNSWTFSSTTDDEVADIRVPGGAYHVRVYGFNQRTPYDLFYSFTNGLDPNVVILDYGISDEYQGTYLDPDGELDPGEQILFWIAATNTGDLYFHSGGGGLSTANGQISVYTSASIRSIPGQSGGLTTNVGYFTIAPDFPVGEYADVSLKIDDGFGRAWTQTLSFLVQGISDDQYETNPVALPPETWLSSYYGPAVQRDLDGFYLEMLGRGEPILAEIQAAGDVDLSTYVTGTGFSNDYYGTATASGEVINLELGYAQGISVTVSGDNSGNSYDFYWTYCQHVQYLADQQVVELGGNGDGFLSAGETGLVYFVVTNQSCGTVSDSTGTLWGTDVWYNPAPDPYLQITPATNVFPSTAAGTTTSNAMAFAVALATNTPEGHSASSVLKIATGYGRTNAFLVKVSSGNPYAMLDTPAWTIVYDDNDDGLINPGEAIDFTLCLTNRGGAETQTIQIDMSTTSGLASAVWDREWYYSIGAHSFTCSTINGTPFKLVLDPGYAQTNVHVRLHTAYNGGAETSQVFDLLLPVVVPPPAMFAQPTLLFDDDMAGDSWGNGDGIIDPEESIEMTVCLENIGDTLAYDIQVDLSSTSSANTVIWGQRWYEDIPGGASTCQTWDATVFLFELDPGFDTNETLHLQLDISFTGGDNQTFEYQVPVGSDPNPASVTGLVVVGPATAIEVSNTWYTCRQQMDDESTINVSTNPGVVWTTSLSRVDVWMDYQAVHITPGVSFSNEDFQLSCSYDGWYATSTVTIIDQPYPVAAYDFQNVTPGTTPGGWYGPGIFPAAWSAMAETNYSPTNICLKLLAPDNGLLPVEVSRSRYMNAYMYFELWLDISKPVVGGNPTNTRNQIWLSYDQAGLTFRRPLCSILENGSLLDMNGSVLATVSTQGWFQLDILYMQFDSVIATVTCWYDKEMLQTAIQPVIQPLYEEQLGHFLISNLRGQTLVDNVSFAVDPFKAIAESTTIDNLILTAEGMEFDWEAFPALRYQPQFLTGLLETNWTDLLPEEIHGMGTFGGTNAAVSDEQIIRIKMLLPEF